MNLRIGFLISHPIQYYAPIFRELARACELTVFFAHRQTADQQARAGFGVAFDWDVDLLSGYRSKFLENVARHPSTERFFGCDTPGVSGAIASGRFDGFVVPGWALRCYLQAAHACRRSHIPVFVRGDSTLISQRRSALLPLGKAVVLPWLLRRFDGYLYVGERNREYLLRYGAVGGQLYFSPHCVDNDAFRRGAEAAGTAALNSPTEAARNRRVLFVGKLVERKRPMDILRAAALLKDRKRPVEVAFAGAGELEGPLRHEAASLGVAAIFHGFVNQSRLPAIYAAADVVVLPSDGQETWGLVINEAMACGVPAVVSDAVGCAPDLIVPGSTGAVFALGDVGSFADAIEKAISLGPAITRQALAERMAVYSPRRAAQGIIEGVSSLAARSRPQGELR